MKRGSLEHRVALSVAAVSGISLAWLLVTATAELSAVRRAAVVALAITLVRAVWESIRLARR